MTTPPSNLATHHTDHLANERTFLAWIRTSISVIGLGFVVAKFSVWLRQMAPNTEQAQNAHKTGLSLPLGIGMMIAGGLLSVIAAFRYRKVQQAIQAGNPAPGVHSITAVTLIVLAMTAALVAYMLVTN